MAVNLNSKSLRPTAHLRLAYSAPASEERAGAGIHRYTLPATKALPFVKLRAHDQPLWRPEGYWHVKSTGKREMDLRLGRKYARQAVAAIKSDHNTQLIVHVIQDMLRDANKRTNKKGHDVSSAIVRGFLAEIGEILATVS